MRMLELLAFSLFLTASPAFAEEMSGDASTADLKRVEESLRKYLSIAPVPDPVALETLGESTLKVERPGSIRSAIAAVDSVVSDGSFVPGGAIEVSPWYLTKGRSSLFDDYEKAAVQFLSGLSVSLAIAKSPLANGELRGAIGLRSRLVDETDWRRNIPAIRQALDTVDEYYEDRDPEVVTEGTVVPFPSELTKKINEVFSKYPSWNAFQAAAGVGYGFASRGGRIESHVPGKINIWTSFAVPQSKTLQWTVTPRADYQFAIPGSDTSAATDEYLGGGAFDLAWRTDPIVSKATFGLGARWKDRKYAGVYTLALSFVVPVGEETFVELGVSTENDTANGGSRLLGSVKFKGGSEPHE